MKPLMEKVMEKRKNILLSAVLAGMLAVPASYAAIDDAGMQYTSAAEGFYGSLRMELSSSDTDNATGTDEEATNFDSAISRLGVRGTVDLGGGLSAHYRYEFGVNGSNGDPIGSTRLHQVGLDGNFGSIVMGTQWALDYNYVWGITDVMNNRSGSFAYNADRAGRQSNAFTYTSPDFNGFNFGFSAIMDGEAVNVDRSALDAVSATTLITVTPAVGSNPEVVLTTAIPGCDNDEFSLECTSSRAAADAVAIDADEAAAVDKIVAAAGFSHRGFNVAGTYVRRDVREVTLLDLAGNKVESNTNPRTYGVALGYGQDNWSVGYYYANTDQDDPNNTDEKVHSFAAQLQVGKTTLRGVYEMSEEETDNLGDHDGDSTTADTIRRDGTDVDFYTLSAQYDLGSKSRIWIEYNGSETDEVGTADDSDTTVFAIGHRVDF